MSDERASLTEPVPILPPRPKLPKDASMGQKLQAFAKWLQATRPMRAMKHFGERNGGLLAGGMAYSGLFSFFAAIWVLFSVAGVVLAGRPDLVDQLISYLGATIPGLVGENGVVSADALRGLSASFTISGVIALVSTLWTAMNFLNGARVSIRAIFDVPPQPPTSFVMTKVRDLGLMVLIGVLLIISAVLTAVSSGLTIMILRDVLHAGLGTWLEWIIRIGGLVISLAFDTCVIALILRALSQVRISRHSLWEGAVIGAVLVNILKQLGSALLGGASSNPLLATFGALLGVLIFFNFMCMVLLITASWVKTSMDDRKEAPRVISFEEADALANEAELLARRERLAAERIRLEAELADTPRWSRGALRREWDRVIAEQADTEAQYERLRLGIDPDADNDGQGEPTNERDPEKATS